MNNIVSERIQARLDALNKNPSSVALEAGLGRSSVRDIISGRVSSSRLDTLRKLTGPLQCTLDYLTGDSDAPDEESIHRRHIQLDVFTDAIPTAAEAGVFRPVLTTDAKRQYLANLFSHRPYSATRDYRIPAWGTSLFEMMDNSLEHLHILKGDVVTVAQHPFDVQIPLTEGSLVAVQHTLRQPTLEEVSIRQVTVSQSGGISLVSQQHGRMQSIDIPSRSVDNESKLVPNFYPLDGASVEILGIAVRIERQIKLSDAMSDLSSTVIDE